MDPVLLIALIIGAVCVFAIIVWAIIALVAMRQMRRIQRDVAKGFGPIAMDIYKRNF